MPSSIGSTPDEDIFVTIVRGLGRARMIREVIKVLDLVSKFERNPSLKLFNSILDVLVKEDIDLAREFYRKKMMGCGVRGDEYTFWSLMNEVAAPNEVTFNILISAYCREENLVQALVMLEKSFGYGFVPDVVTLTKVIEILSNVGRVSEAVEVLERVESKGGNVDVVAYNILIKGFCRTGKTKIAFRYLKEMENKGCLPNVDTYNALISGFCEAGMLDSALDVFHEMKTAGISWNFVTYDTLIGGLCSGGRTKDGFKILELMEESKGGSGGRISPYNSVVYGLYKENRMDEAVEFLTKMGKMFPRAVDRSFRILGFCEEGCVENAKRVYDQMTGEGGVPSAIVYAYLIHGLCQKGFAKEAIELTSEMFKLAYFPIASTFNALINEFCSQGKVGSAIKFPGGHD
ncbi:pentatricopeptide repeat (PPR) superfamily protein [Actinidia rufa]|uniref:Pentatricopeptide repeat (PPR) superfamily protein n=1 Tax=Actinidia rufa TaxID=165716 RepID=A0A7J0ENI6_9ERIC|nr:pentatricopeptide repeat (PPR) superfamily protein [Actinidia rufa]